MDFWTSFWFIFGGVLILLELLLPGGIAFFMGAGALFIGALHLLEVINSPLTGFTIWFIISTIMMFTLKGLVEKFIPHIKNKGNINEDLDAYGQIVEVVEDICHESPGRIEYLGSTWPARSNTPGSILKSGTKAQLLFKENLTWVVDPAANKPQEN